MGMRLIPASCEPNNVVRCYPEHCTFLLFSNFFFTTVGCTVTLEFAHQGSVVRSKNLVLGALLFAVVLPPPLASMHR